MTRVERAAFALKHPMTKQAAGAFSLLTKVVPIGALSGDHAWDLTKFLILGAIGAAAAGGAGVGYVAGKAVTPTATDKENMQREYMIGAQDSMIKDQLTKLHNESQLDKLPKEDARSMRALQV